MPIPGLLTGAVEQTIGFGVGGALQSALAPEATELAQDAWSTRRILALDPQTAAVLVRLGLITHEKGSGNAAKYGVSDSDFGLMVLGSRSVPAPTELIELTRRNVIPFEDLEMHLQRAGVDSRYSKSLAQLVFSPLSPSDAAMARQQGFITEEEAVKVSAEGGADAHEAEVLYELAGLPPGVGEALDMLRRGMINDAMFAQIVREGHTKTKYTDLLKGLRYRPLSAAQAAEALVRERTTPEHAHSIAEANGMHAEDFDLYVEMLGRPMGIGQALTLVRRGEMNHDEFRAVVSRSDVKTEYTDDLLKLAVVYPPLFQIMRLVTAGTIEDAYAKEILTKEGYPPKLVDGMIAGAHKSKTKTTRHLTVAIVETLYEAGLETHAQAETALDILGYSREEADELLQVAKARRIVSELAHGVTLVRGRYTTWKIDSITARDLLASLELDGETIDRLIKWWDSERTANQPKLTAPQIVAGYHNDRFTLEEAEARLVKLGWAPDDALTLIWIREHHDPRPGAEPTT